MRSTGERLAFAAAGLVTALMFVVLYAPVAVSALFSVVEFRHGAVQWDTASWRWYRALLDNGPVIEAIGTSAVVAGIAVGAALIAGVALAIYTAWPGAMLRRTLEVVIYLPFLLPPIVTGLSLLITLDRLGVPRGLATVSVGHFVFVLAVVYRIVATRIQALPRSLVEASADLGARGWQTLRFVLLPHLGSAIVAAALLALTLSLDETLISAFLAGSSPTLPLRLWAMMRMGFTPAINAYTTLVLLASLLLAAITARTMRPATPESDG